MLERIFLRRSFHNDFNLWNRKNGIQSDPGYSVWLAGSVPRIRGACTFVASHGARHERKRDGTAEKLERPRRNRVLSSPSSLNRAPGTSSVACFSRLIAFPVKHATGELSKEKARRQLSLRWNTRRLVDQVRTRECPMSSIRGRIEVSLYTPLL